MGNYYTERGFANPVVMSAFNRDVNAGSHPGPDISTLQDPDALLQWYLSVIPGGSAYISAVEDIWRVTPLIPRPCTPILGPTQGRGAHLLPEGDGFNLENPPPPPYTVRNDTSQVVMVNPQPQNSLPQNPLLVASQSPTTPETQFRPQEATEPTPQSNHPPPNYNPLEVWPPYLGGHLYEWYMGEGRWHPIQFTSRGMPYIGNIPPPTTPRFGSPEPEGESQPPLAEQEQLNQQARGRLGQSIDSPEPCRAREPGETATAARPPLVRFNTYQPSAPGGSARTSQHPENRGEPVNYDDRGAVVGHSPMPTGPAIPPQPPNSRPSARPYGNPPPGWGPPGLRPMTEHGYLWDDEARREYLIELADPVPSLFQRPRRSL